MGGLQGALGARESCNSTNYNFMQQPLLSGDVLTPGTTRRGCRMRSVSIPMIMWRSPRPRGQKGRAFMPVVVGLAIPKSAPDAPPARA